MSTAHREISVAIFRLRNTKPYFTLQLFDYETYFIFGVENVN